MWQRKYQVILLGLFQYIFLLVIRDVCNFSVTYTLFPLLYLITVLFENHVYVRYSYRCEVGLLFQRYFSISGGCIVRGTGRVYCLVGTIRLTAGNLCGGKHTSFVISHLTSPRQKAGGPQAMAFDSCSGRRAS